MEWVQVKFSELKNRDKFWWSKAGTACEKLELVDDKSVLIYKYCSTNSVICNVEYDGKVYVQKKHISLEKLRPIFAEDEKTELKVLKKTPTQIKCLGDRYWVAVGNLQTFEVVGLVAKYWAELINKELNS